MCRLEGGGDVEKFHVDGLGCKVRGDGEGRRREVDVCLGAIAEEVDADDVGELNGLKEHSDAVGCHCR